MRLSAMFFTMPPSDIPKVSLRPSGSDGRVTAAGLDPKLRHHFYFSKECYVPVTVTLGNEDNTVETYVLRREDAVREGGYPITAPAGKLILVPMYRGTGAAEAGKEPRVR